MNTSLVEIAQINPNHRDQDLLSRLTSALMQCCGHRADAAELEGAAWTIFAELIDNIFSHSQTPIDGYAALQLYQRGDNLSVAVSDSGLGIMETLRPTLKTESPSLARLSDIELMVEIFRQGISRHGADRGCGLKGSAAKAIKFKSKLDVRLPTSRVLLVPSDDGYKPSTAYCYNSLPLIWGTHICFNFSLH
ncbi:MAG: sensor histidine kinase [Deltaproteobacteria bacterium]|nr:sensor histidine kinase [Deltaproteobacteria bacterium]